MEEKLEQVDKAQEGNHALELVDNLIHKNASCQKFMAIWPETVLVTMYRLQEEVATELI